MNRRLWSLVALLNLLSLGASIMLLTWAGPLMWGAFFLVPTLIFFVFRRKIPRTSVAVALCISLIGALPALIPVGWNFGELFVASHTIIIPKDFRGLIQLERVSTKDAETELSPEGHYALPQNLLIKIKGPLRDDKIRIIDSDGLELPRQVHDYPDEDRAYFRCQTTRPPFQCQVDTPLNMQRLKTYH